MSITYEDMATTLPSAIDQNQIKLMKNSEAYIVPADIIKTITITSKDEYTGKVVIKVTFEKAGKKVEKEFELQFNKKPLDLNSLTLDSTLNIEGIVPNVDTLASSILKENVKLTFKEEFANILEVVTYSLEAKDVEGKLTLSVEFKNRLNNETKTLSKEYTGFKVVSGTTKKFRLQELYALSESKTLFHVKNEAELKKQLLKLKDQPNDQRIEIIDNGIKFFISGHSTGLSTVLVLDPTVKGKVKTGSGQKNIGLAGKVGSSKKTNGINVHFYNDGRISFKWKLYLDNGQLDDIEYEQIVVNS
ncbi:lipoprotein 17-related variable surface protein [Metamycoplasma orale]|nr:lipoprotein 17-related variable surface protein [Metamycoplasma orale]